MNKQRSLRNAYELVKTKYFRYVGIMFLFVAGSALLSDQELLNNIFIYHFVIGRNRREKYICGNAA